MTAPDRVDTPDAPGVDTGRDPQANARPRSKARRILSVMVAIAVLAFAAPVLVDVYSQIGNVLSLPSAWLLAIVVAEASQFLAVWQIQRIVLRTKRWLGVAAPQLVGNAASNLVPGANATGLGVHVTMLMRAGFPATKAIPALAVTSASRAIGFIVLPLVVLVATAAGSDVDPRLVGAMWFGAGVLSCVLITLVAIARRDRPWRLLVAAVAAILRLLRRDTDAEDLGRRLLQERDLIADAIRRRPGTVLLASVGQTAGDFLVLYFALRAAGATVNPAAVLAAFLVGEVAGMLPFTPAGIGFVEAGLAGTLRIAGVATQPALVALAATRLTSIALPSAAALVAFVLFQHRHRPPLPSDRRASEREEYARP